MPLFRLVSFADGSKPCWPSSRAHLQASTFRTKIARNCIEPATPRSVLCSSRTIKNRPLGGLKDFNLKRSWAVSIAAAIATALIIRWLRAPKLRVFDDVRRTDKGSKLRAEIIYGYLNRSARTGSAECRALIEAWLKRIPTADRATFVSRFRCGDDAQFSSAVQELTLHQLLRTLGCKIRFHPNVPGTTKQPDFIVRQPRGSAFLLEACTSRDIASGPQGGPRANRIRDFLQGLDLEGYLIGIDELTEGSSDLSQRLVAKHIEAGIKTGAASYAPESISIPLLTTADGWRIKLTAFPVKRYGTRRGTLIQEAWTRSWSGPSYPWRDSLKKKGSRYGDQLSMPYVIAVNSSDVMVTDHDFKKTLFGSSPQASQARGGQSSGFWGTDTAPIHRRVSAVLFTTNLWPATLLTISWWPK